METSLSGIKSNKACDSIMKLSKRDPEELRLLKNNIVCLIVCMTFEKNACMLGDEDKILSPQRPKIM